MVRLRQLIDRFSHRLLVRPLLFVAAAALLSQLMLAADRWAGSEPLPRWAETTVDSGRTILSAIATGLISTVALLLSLMLVAVQLASSQFSPRSLRDWTGDRTQQNAIGLVLGTAVYCLLILRETRTFGEEDSLTPHLSVLLAMLGGVAALVGVVIAVDHLTDSLRVGRIADALASDSVGVIHRTAELRSVADPAPTPAPPRPGEPPSDTEPPPGAAAIESPMSGWIQQIDEDAILEAIGDGRTVQLAVSLGEFVATRVPLAWVWPTIEGDELDHCRERLVAAVAIGDTRTMQQDVGFGILQLVDIAVRALSPGINDPNTANDMVAHLGVVLLALWEQEAAPTRRSEDGRTLIRRDLDHGDHLRAAVDPIRRYGAGDPEVAINLIRTLGTLRSETVRRDLPGPIEPIDEAIERIVDAVERGDLPECDRARVRATVPER